jgi:hypothetical protein
MGSTSSATLPVASGLFTATLNAANEFGSIFDGRDIYLQVAVRRPAGTGVFTVLSPRVAITPAPLASGLVRRAIVRDSLGTQFDHGFSVTSGGGTALYAEAAGNSFTVLAAPVAVQAQSANGVGVFAASTTTIGVEGVTSTGIAILGNSGPSGYAGWFNGAVNITGSLSVTGKVNLSQASSRVVINSVGGLPLSNSFTSNGGTLMLTYSGSGYLSTLPSALIGMIVSVDGAIIDNTGIFANQAGMHLAFVNKTWVLTNIPAGSHTIALARLNTVTATDTSDIFNVTVTEMPF